MYAKTLSVKAIFTYWVVGGCLVWLVPFLLSIPLHDSSGELRIDLFLFKRLMLLVSTSFGGWLLLHFLRRMSPSGWLGSLLGGGWMLINWGLDALILLPLSGMSIESYIFQIGLGYFGMPIQGALIGRAMEDR